MIIRANQRKLRANHSRAYPARVLFLDTETIAEPVGDETRHRFGIGVTHYASYDGAGRIHSTERRHWRDPLSLCRYIEGKVTAKKALYIYGHNIFFDLQVSEFYHHFPRWGWTLKFFYDAGLTHILVIRRDERTIKVVSTTNYFDFSLRILGEDVGLPKLDVTFGSAPVEDLFPYCERDVEITAASLQRYMEFNRLHDTGKFSLTRASQSFSAYRHRFMSEAVYFHDRPEITALERAAYFGGRTECFFIGEPAGGPFTFLDVNSMYPHVMREYRYPRRLFMHVTDPTDGFLSQVLGRAAYIARVRIRTEDPAYAVRGENKVLFPVGEFDTYVCTGGLERAIRRGELVKIYELAVYEAGDLFSDYVEYFYPLKSAYKSEGNAIYTRMVKLYLNSLYGKFGQQISEDTYESAPDHPGPARIHNIDTASGVSWTETYLFNTRIISSGRTEGTMSLAAIPAHVTEYARLQLWDHIRSAGAENVLYCDTDSLVVPAHLAERIAPAGGSTRLGRLAVDKTAERLALHGPKDYELDGVLHAKGIPAGAEELGPATFGYDQFLGMISHLTAGEDRVFITRRVEKHLAREYDKGIVTAGGRVEPYRFST